MTNETEVMNGLPTGAPETKIEPGTASNEECHIAARQLQKYIEEKPFSQGGEFFMEGLVLHGELEMDKEISTTARAFRAVKRIEMDAAALANYGFIVPAGHKRVYQLEISLVCDTVTEEVMAVNPGAATNEVAPDSKDE